MLLAPTTIPEPTFREFGDGLLDGKSKVGTHDHVYDPAESKD